MVFCPSFVWLSNVPRGFLLGCLLNLFLFLWSLDSCAQLAGDHFKHIWPKSTVSRFSSIQYLNDSVWIAYNDFPNTLRTDDKGLTWRKLPIYTTASIRCVHFISPEIGFAGDNRGTIYQTNDGGKDWQIVFQDNSTYPMTFYNTNERFRLVFTKITSTDSLNIYCLANYRYVIHSSDQGKSWKPIDTELKTREMNDIQFGSNEVGYIFAKGLILKTENAGASWPLLAEESSSANGVGFYCWDEKKIYLLRSSSTLRYSDDGGVNWYDRKFAYYDSTGKEFENDHFNLPRLSIWRHCFADSLNGLMLVNLSNRGSFLAYTKDGGRTIHQLPGRLYFGSDMISYNPFGDYYVIQKDNRDIFTMGRDFRLKQLFKNTPTNTIGSITAIDSNHAMILTSNPYWISDRYPVHHLINDSSFYDTIPFFIGDRYANKPPLTILNPKVFYGVAEVSSKSRLIQDGIVRTTDGGSTWEVALNLRERPEMGTWVCSFKAFSVDSLYLLTVDSASRMLRFFQTTDGGQNWALVHSDFDDFSVLPIVRGEESIFRTVLFVMDFWNKNLGLIYLGGEHILRTKDAGKTWEYERIAERDFLGERSRIRTGEIYAELLPNGQGYLAYFNPNTRDSLVIFRTIDFGLTWRMTIDDKNNITAFRVSANGYAYRIPNWSGSPIYQTTNTGQTWEPFVVRQATHSITDLSFYSATGGFAIDLSGNVYRFTYPWTYRAPIVLNTSKDINAGAGVIYPNPTDGQLYFHLMNAEPSQARLFDLSGKKLIDYSFSTMGRISIDISPFQSGIYLLEIENQGKKTVHKVVRH